MRDFEADRKLCEAATPGPWEIGRYGQCVVSESAVGTHCGDGEREYYGGNLVCEGAHAENSQFIAQAREGWPAALREIKKLIARIRISAATNKELVRIIQESERENARLRIALHDAINRPMGVVPDSAVEFYDQDNGGE